MLWTHVSIYTKWYVNPHCFPAEDGSTTCGNWDISQGRTSRNKGHCQRGESGYQPTRCSRYVSLWAVSIILDYFRRFRAISLTCRALPPNISPTLFYNSSIYCHLSSLVLSPFTVHSLIIVLQPICSVSYSFQAQMSSLLCFTSLNIILCLVNNLKIFAGKLCHQYFLAFIMSLIYTSPFNSACYLSSPQPVVHAL